ncbi:hypothetical protein F0562_014237 [Nyssa sinensis]|uniref:Gnk2-homologous domain-containing protein n=1 Tax=Nyssa sinensis TaxID=561372 RepID=A0A5J4ZSD6_9ASTE|nr:hypothetical protein F0562_014237 [Nyssa sinensis]
MYQTNLNTLLSSLSSNIDRNGFYSSSEGQGSDMVNGIALCRGDVELDICRSCVNDSTCRFSQLCPNNKQAIGWYDYCMLRYSNQSFLGTMDTGPALRMWNTNNISDVVQFNQNLRNLLDGLRGRAGSGGSLRKFATGNTSFTTATDLGTIYGLVQCTPDLSEQLCSNCLIGAMQEIGSCCVGYRGGRVIYPSCNLRFELDDPFYNETTPDPPLLPPPASSGKDSNTTRTIIIVVVPTVIFIIIVLCICIFLRKKKRKPIEEFEKDLLSYAWKNWREGSAANVIDPTLRAAGSGSLREIMRCIHIGLLCIQENVADRPNMASVVLMLNSFSLTLQVPSEPAFFMHSSIDPEMPLLQEYDSGVTDQSRQSKSKSTHVSLNEASITELYPR